MEVPVVQRPGPRLRRLPSPNSLKGRLVWGGEGGREGKRVECEREVKERKGQGKNISKGREGERERVDREGRGKMVG